MPGVVQSVAERLCRNVERVLVGKRAIVELAVVSLLCEGHVLIEDVPGIGKTTLARSLAQSIGGTFRRLQCTPDLLPSDVTGVSVFDQRSSEFSFRQGPIFANVLLADEINRATPRTQSAVLEAMQEAQVSVDGVTRPLPRPFVVLATQNPVELEGTFPLPEAQLDRFLVRLSLGYPSEADEEAMVARGVGVGAIALEPVVSCEEVLDAIMQAARVRVHEDVRHYLVQVTRATRIDADVRLGASPRATLALHRATQAWAAIQGREFVLPDDVKRLAVPVLAHRLIASLEARLRGRDAAAIVQAILDSVVVPVAP
ncbi:MAG: MoxR family ATPase [Chloroflexi bacterium]|nr:MoxR family ATPase [Chloroflexota bacterium]MBV9895236.1 MoxR family ATPase [Chloroflexota bacterium]